MPAWMLAEKLFRLMLNPFSLWRPRHLLGVLAIYIGKQKFQLENHMVHATACYDFCDLRQCMFSTFFHNHDLIVKWVCTEAYNSVPILGFLENQSKYTSRYGITDMWDGRTSVSVMWWAGPYTKFIYDMHRAYCQDHQWNRYPSSTQEACHTSTLYTAQLVMNPW